MVKRCFGSESAVCFTKSKTTAAGNNWVAASARKPAKKVQAFTQKERGSSPALPKWFYEKCQPCAGIMLSPSGKEGNLAASGCL
ncbi:MAG: hypothetical protein K9H26_02150 [Prolixibacteraceae bacterium]|nr:hypothetical protein [Prolixibacteraceae bacterium]